MVHAQLAHGIQCNQCLQYHRHGLFKLNSYGVLLRNNMYHKIDNREPYKSGYRGIANCIYFTILRKNTCTCTQLQQSTNFTQRVGLDNSYCNCFHLMCCVEKSTRYIEKKEQLAVIHRVKVLGTTNSLALQDLTQLDVRPRFSPVSRRESMLQMMIVSQALHE